MKKKITIGFADFWTDFETDRNCNFYEDVQAILSERYEVELSDHPQYLFYSTHGYEHLYQEDCIRIFLTHELFSPDFNECDYAFGSDYLSFGDRYMRYAIYRTSRVFPQALEKHLITDEEIAKKRKFCSFTVSNSYADDIRKTAFEKLNQYKKVDSGGRFLNNVGGPVEDKLAFESEHKFSLCFENCVGVGYTTEKIVDAFAAKTVPIYYGSPRIAEEFNPDSFIDCSKCKSLDEMVELVKKVDNDDALYRKMLRTPICDDAEIFRQNEDFKSFLLHIFEQDYEEAKRIPRKGQWIHNEMARRRERLDAWKFMRLPPKSRLKRDFLAWIGGKKHNK